MWGDVIGVLVNWFPMLLLIGVWIYFMRKMGYAKGGITQSQYMAEVLAEMKRSNAAFEQLLTKIDERLQHIETKTGGTV